MLQRKKVYIERKVQCCSWVVHCWIYLFFLFFVLQSEVSGILGSTFVSVLFSFLDDLFLFPSSQWTEPVQLLRNNRRKSCGCALAVLRVVWCHVYLTLGIKHQSAISVLYLPFPASSLFFCFYPETSVLLRQDLNFLNINILLLYYRCCYWYQRCHVFAVNIVPWFIFAQMKAIIFPSCVCACMFEWMDELFLPLNQLPLCACVVFFYTHSQVCHRKYGVLVKVIEVSAAIEWH